MINGVVDYMVSSSHVIHRSVMVGRKEIGRVKLEIAGVRLEIAGVS